MRRPVVKFAAVALFLSPLLAVPTASAGATSTDLVADPTGRWIVVLKPNTDAVAESRAVSRKVGFRVDRTYRSVVRGYAAKMSTAQVSRVRGEPDVLAVVPDEKIEIEAQALPTGIPRIGATRSPIARIDNVDDRVDADVAIVDTGIASLPDLNVVGGYSCSNTNPAAWFDVNGHGTHVAGTVGAIDNGSGVVGVAPGVRLWSVKILDNSGAGLLSWYICGLDWITAQRDPVDSSKPLFEAVNMSVTKWGQDDANCGNTNADPLHQAICRVVASGVTVVAAAANDGGNAALRVPASYNEVITVSALADTDGKPGGLGGNRCYSWGGYDKDDTFADFSNYGGDVDLIAPGKCIWSTVPNGYQYMSGTSMAAPHVTGAVALLKQDRPGLTPAEVKEALQYLGNLNWKTSTDPDLAHERLLDVSRIGVRGDFSVSAGVGYVSPGGGTARIPITVTRDATSFERVRFSVSGLPSGATASFSPTSVYGFAPATTTLSISIPAGAVTSPMDVTVTADEHGTRHRVDATINLDTTPPTATAPSTAVQSGVRLGPASVPVVVAWPGASDDRSGIGTYEIQRRMDNGGWTAVGTTTGSRTLTTREAIGHVYQYRLRARDWAGNWSAWAAAAARPSQLVQETSPSIVWGGRWTREANSTVSGGAWRWSATNGSKARLTFTGRGIAIVAAKSSTRGVAAIYLDGSYRGTVNLASTTGVTQLVVWSGSWPTSGTHRIDWQVSGGKRIDLDAFVILR